MESKNLLFQSVCLAALIGGGLALYISLTTFWQMPHRLWLAFNDTLVVISILLTAFVGYTHRSNGRSFRLMMLSVGTFFLVLMFLYLTSYLVTTKFSAERMVWIPYFHLDYTYHGFKSVADYLNYQNNFRELFELQVVSLLICSVLYLAAGSLGYGAQPGIDGLKSRLTTRLDI